MCLNIFYLSPIHRKSVSIELKTNENIDDLYKNISSKESISEKTFKLYSNGKRLESVNHLTNDSVIELHFGLNGGKGGFGSMLRAIGAQIEKTTNREACRDLTGRRLRDINEEKRIKEWIKKEKLRKEEIDERKRQKLEKLSQKPKTEFNDLEFERNRSEIPDIVDSALQYGLQLKQKEGQTSGEHKRKSEKQIDDKIIKKKKVSLWIANDIDIEDDSDDNEVQTIDDHNNDNQSSKDSLTSNTNDSEVIIDLKSVETQELHQKVCESLKSTEDFVERSDDNIESNVNPVSKQISEFDKQKTETKVQELDEIKVISTSDSSHSKEKEVFEALNLMDFESVPQLESLGLDRLKHSLMALGLKCGGTLSERANRLWSIRGLDIKDIPKKLLAKKK